MASSTKYQFRQEQRLLLKEQKEGKVEEENNGDSNAKDSTRSHQWTFLQDIPLPSDALSADVCIQMIGNHKSIYVAYEIASIVSIYQLCVDFGALTRAFQGEGGVTNDSNAMVKLEKISKDFHYPHDSTAGTTSKLYVTCNIVYDLMYLCLCVYVLDSIGVQLWPASSGVALTVLQKLPCVNNNAETIIISKHAILESNNDGTSTTRPHIHALLQVQTTAMQTMQLNLPVELKGGSVRLIELLPIGTPFIHISVNNIGYVVSD